MSVYLVNNMAKKKEESIEEILNRIEDDINLIRNKLWLDKVELDEDIYDSEDSDELE